MASLRKHPKSTFWFACFTDSNGIRTSRSTKTRDRSKALKMAVEWESAAKRAREGSFTEAQARSVINSIMEHAGQEPVTFYKTADWLNEWLGEKRKSQQIATVQKYEPVIRRFLKHIGPKANAGLASLTPTNIRTFRDTLSSEGRAARTVNQIIAKVLSAPLAKAVTLGYMPLNPCKAVDALTEIKTEAGTFTLDQIAALLNVAPSKDWRGLVLVGFYTGQRLRDLADLTWEQVDLAKERIYFKQGKTGSKVVVPIHRDLLDHLLEIPAPKTSKAPVFPSLFGTSGTGRSGLSEAFKRLMIKAGIEMQKRLESAGGVGRGRNELSFHSLRHSFNSAMANAGIAQEIRQKLTGHRDKDTNTLYTHLDIPALQSAVNAVPSLKEKKTSKPA